MMVFCTVLFLFQSAIDNSTTRQLRLRKRERTITLKRLEPSKLMLNPIIKEQTNVKCLWKVSTDPRTIPGGYSFAKHQNLQSTIARELKIQDTLNIMAYYLNHDTHCIGWLHNQLGEGNNLTTDCNDGSHGRVKPVLNL